MILISDKNTQKTYYFPKEKNGADAATLKLFSHLSKSEYTFDISGCTTLDLYYAINVDFSGCYDGEYEWTIYDAEENVLQNGLLRVGKIENPYIIYDFKEEYVIYNPETGESEIIEYGDCTDAVNEAYRSGYQSGNTVGYENGYASGLTQGFPTGYESGRTDGINIGYGSGYTEGYQSGYTNGYESGASATYEDAYQAGYQAGHTDGEEEGFVVGYNSGYTDGYSSGWTDGYASGSTSGSTGGTYLIMSASTYNLSAEDDELSWTWSANTEWKLTVESPWGGGETFISAGSGSPVYAIGQNDTLSARTFTYIGENFDTEVTLTFTQAASAYTPTPSSGYASMPFTIQMLEDGDITFRGNGSTLYQVNGGERQVLNGSISGLSAGDEVQFTVSADTINTFTNNGLRSNARHNAKGNIMSLLYVDFESATTLPYERNFESLFLSNAGLINAENLVLPATTLSEGCYWTMFKGCTNLITAPVLPATTLASKCYREMFGYCTSLTTAPVLPATTLVYDCYYLMFVYCHNLNYIKCLATDNMAGYCTHSWVDGVSSTGTFIKSASMNDWGTGNDGIPNGWTVNEE